MLRLFAVLACVLFSPWVISQTNDVSYFIIKSNETIKTDGELNESVWKTIEPITTFYQNFPYDSAESISKTEVKITYDDHHIHIAAICYDEFPQKEYVIQSLRRDFDADVSDCFQVIIDPFKDKLNGFVFGISPFGVQREGLISEGGSWGGVNMDWDNVWFSAAKVYDGYWVAEIAIPFRTLRFRHDIIEWGMNFSRNDLKRNERSSWAKIPRNFNVTAVAFANTVSFEKLDKKGGLNTSIIPYATTGANQDFQAGTPLRNIKNIGTDAKVAITPSLNLDMTVNPDFSQVEVDRQVTNLSRFSIFFPERRNFFLENSDLFARFGFSRIRPFFSRQIGLAFDSVNRLYTTVPILAGARLSGRIDKNWRIGAMNMHTAPREDLKIIGQNYSVFAMQRRVFTRSSLGMILVNRQGMNTGSFFSFNGQNFNRLFGIDYNLASGDNKWQGKIFWHQTFSNYSLPDVVVPKGRPSFLYNNLKNVANASWLSYSTRKWFIMWNHEHVGRGYNAEVGFVPRTGYTRLEPMVQYIMYTDNKKLNNHGPQIYSDFYFDLGFKALDRLVQFGYNFNYTSTAFVNLRYNINYTYLFFNFDPTNTGGKELLAGTEYNTSGYELYYSSNVRKKFNYIISANYGGYFNGKLFAYDMTLRYRTQPWGILSLGCTYNNIALPKPYKSTQLFLIGPRVDLSFTKSIFFTTFLQYNSQIENFNINARLQWRFRPVSDLFIVYSDNYASGIVPNAYIRPKNRAIVIKLSYWFNA